MDPEKAIELIRNGIEQNEKPQIWADLGCGNGTFTIALATLLQSQSIIYAMDKDQRVLHSIPENHNSVSIEKQRFDFMSAEYPFRNVDGLIMANSLHYSNNKSAVLNKIHSSMKMNGNLIIIEYAVRYSNPMVPFPVKKYDLTGLLDECGFNEIENIGEMRSRYGHQIYSVAARRN